MKELYKSYEFLLNEEDKKEIEDKIKELEIGQIKKKNGIFQRLKRIFMSIRQISKNKKLR